MKRIHPNLRHAASITVAVMLVGLAGCRTPQGGAVNPFLAPDRVPPPATRAILPGQAQPYYPGDPLPLMQSATQPTASSNSSDRLAGNAPNATTSTPNASPAARSLAFSNEPTVEIPADDDDLRFPLPEPREPEPTTPVAMSDPAAQQPVQLAAVPAAQMVVPASYMEPVLNGPTPARDGSFDYGEPVASGPWRSPQIGASTASVVYGVPPVSPGPAPIVPQANTMDVRLRAVPSPPPQPVESNTPRIRLPGYASPQPLSGAGMLMPPTAGNVVQIQTTIPLPPPPYDPALNLAAAPRSPVTGDGFRRRSSMR